MAKSIHCGECVYAFNYVCTKHAKHTWHMDPKTCAEHVNALSVRRRYAKNKSRLDWLMQYGSSEKTTQQEIVRLEKKVGYDEWLLAFAQTTIDELTAAQDQAQRLSDNSDNLTSPQSNAQIRGE